MYAKYTALLILSAVLDVISHTIKEALVRSQPLNQEKFNFRISLIQLCLGLLFLPFIKATRPHLPLSEPFQGQKYVNMNYFEYAKEYIGFGFACMFNIKSYPYQDENEKKIYTNDGQCDNSWMAILGYTISLFIIQYNLNSIMHHKYTRAAQLIYAFMVPLTIIAFLLAMLVVSPEGLNPTVYDVLGLIITAVGVFVMNWFKEKPQRVCIMEDENQTSEENLAPAEGNGDEDESGDMADEMMGGEGQDLSQQHHDGTRHQASKS